MCELFILNYINISIEKNPEISSIIAKNISSFFERNFQKFSNQAQSNKISKVIKFYLKIIDFVKTETIKKNK